MSMRRTPPENHVAATPDQVADHPRCCSSCPPAFEVTGDRLDNLTTRGPRLSDRPNDGRIVAVNRSKIAEIYR